MSYIGNPPAEAYTNTVKDTFSGDGSTVAFTLSLPTTTNNVRVVVENVIQDPTVAYGVSGTTLTFTSAPPSGTNNIYVVHLGPAVQTVQPPSDLSGNFTLTGDFLVTGDFTISDKIIHAGDTNTAIRFPAADTVTIETSGSERMRIDSSGFVGIGTSSPSSFFSDSYLVVGDGTGTPTSTIYGSSTGTSYMLFADGTTGSAAYKGGLEYNHASDYLAVFANGSERMRISSNGYLRCPGVYNDSAADSANVVVDGSGNIYRSTSALKYKQDIRDIEDIDISQFRPVRYKSNLERDDQTKDHFGFIADEAHDAGYTELVSYGVPDEETGVAEVEGFRYDRMTVLLTKVIQQQQATIDALEARVATLEGGA